LPLRQLVADVTVHPTILLKLCKSVMMDIQRHWYSFRSCAARMKCEEDYEL